MLYSVIERKMHGN